MAQKRKRGIRIDNHSAHSRDIMQMGIEPHKRNPTNQHLPPQGSSLRTVAPGRIFLKEGETLNSKARL